MILEGVPPYDIMVRWESAECAADRLGARYQRWGSAQYPPVNDGTATRCQERRRMRSPHDTEN